MMDLSKRASATLTRIGAKYYKVCVHCKELLELEEFVKSKDRPSGFIGTCKSCMRKQSKVLYWKAGGYNRTYEQNKNQHLKKQYGISLVEYEVIKQKQNNLCAICNSELYEGKGGAALDHDHNTGKIRGILCSPCNKGLGHFRDNTDLLIKATIYLNKENTN